MRKVLDVHRSSELLEPRDRVVGEVRLDRVLDRVGLRAARQPREESRDQLIVNVKRSAYGIRMADRVLSLNIERAMPPVSPPRIPQGDPLADAAPAPRLEIAQSCGASAWPPISLPQVGRAAVPERCMIAGMSGDPVVLEPVRRAPQVSKQTIRGPRSME